MIRSLNEIEGIRDDWNRLLQQVPTASIFSTPEWLLPWFNTYGAGRELLMVAMYDTACERMISLAALMLEMAPAVRQRRTVRFVGDGSGDSDNLEILSVPGREREAISALLDFLNAEHASWDVAHFNTMPSDSTSCRELIQELQKRGWTVRQLARTLLCRHLANNVGCVSSGTGDEAASEDEEPSSSPGESVPRKLHPVASAGTVWRRGCHSCSTSTRNDGGNGVRPDPSRPRVVEGFSGCCRLR